MRLRGLWMGAALAVCLIAQSAQAALFYSFELGGVPITTPINLNQGDHLALQVWINQNGGTTTLTAPAAGTPTNGLGATAVVVQGTPGNVVQISQTDFNNDPDAVMTNGPKWQFASFQGYDYNGVVGQYKLAVGRTTNFATDSGTPNKILIGTFDFTAINAGSAQLTGFDDPAFTDTIAGTNNIPQDPVGSAAPITVNVAGVPEPGSMLLAGLVTAGVGAFRLRRKKVVA